MRRKFLTTVLVVAAALSAIVAQGAESAYLNITGQRQGAFKGGVMQKGREGSIQAFALEHEIISPRDPQSGLPTGKRMHKPFVVELTLDQATPMLYSALSTNENLTTVSLKIFQAGIPAGVEKNTMTVQLLNASVASIKLVQAQPKAGMEEATLAHVEVAFTYQKITWTWMDSGVSASDDWLSPRA